MAKRTHSESLLEEASQVIDNAIASKKQRVDTSESSSETARTGKKAKDRKKDRSEHKSKHKSIDTVSHEASIPPVSESTAALDSANVVSGDQASEELHEKEKKKKKKKEHKAGTSSTQESVTTSGLESNEHTDAATHASVGPNSGLEAKPEKRKREKEEKKAKKDKKQDKSKSVTGDAGVQLNDSIALSAELVAPHADETSTSTSAVANAVMNGSVSSSGDYEQDPGLSRLPQSEIDSFLTSQFIAISDPLAKDEATYRPIVDFKYLPNYDSQREIFKTFKTPSPIQAAAWPFLFAGRDAIGVAETGSGKTLAFGLPCLRYVAAQSQKGRRGGSNVKAVVVSPTRELALQIYDQFVKIAAGTKAKVVCIYGGVPKDEQRTALKTASIIVATPGRLNDFLQEGSADLTSVGYVVLDEADRMLDKGFEDEIRKIISTVPTSTCQTLMFTATWPQSIRELAATFMKNPVKITIGDNPTGDLRANVRVTQLVEVVDPRGKEFRLLQLLKQYQSGKNQNDRILVFCLYKKEATRIENFIRSKGFKVAGIHGDLGQAQRTASLEAFKSGKVPLLVATDVAARGLDIPSVMLVINVTFPLTAEDYVHRIGRTGRAGKEGLAITLFTEHDKAQSGALINVLKAAKQEVPPELLKFGTTVKKKAHDAYGAFYKETSGEEKKASKITFD